MIKLKKSPQINTKADAMKEIEAKKSSSEIIKEDPVTDSEEWTDDPQRWRLFKERYHDEFEDKLDLMNNLMTKKRGKIKVTWISIFKNE
jgi:uncharacterized protein YeaO (DUF488 family)